LEWIFGRFHKVFIVAELGKSFQLDKLILISIL